MLNQQSGEKTHIENGIEIKHVRTAQGIVTSARPVKRESFNEAMRRVSRSPRRSHYDGGCVERMVD